MRSRSGAARLHAFWSHRWIAFTCAPRADWVLLSGSQSVVRAVTQQLPYILEYETSVFSVTVLSLYFIFLIMSYCNSWLTFFFFFLLHFLFFFLPANIVSFLTQMFLCLHYACVFSKWLSLFYFSSNKWILCCILLLQYTARECWPLATADWWAFNSMH